MEDPSNQKDTLSKTTADGDSGITRIHKKFQKPLRIIIVILAVVFAVLIIFNFLKKPYDKTHNEYSTITIEQNEDLNAASQKLQKEGIIGSAQRFVLVSKLVLQTDIKPGTYYLSPSMDSVAIAKALCKGNVTLNGFIIPDGFTVEQTFTSLSRDGLGDMDAFLEAASDPFLQEMEFIGTDIDGRNQVEGFLMPGTYRLDAEADESMIVMTMLDSFNNFFNEDYKARADELGLRVRDVIVIASVIEKETSVDSEKSKISSVIHNRINLDMVSKDELPAVPLCSPGKESIIAALYPDDTEDTYYVLNSNLDGTHVFTSDESEYQELTESYEKARAEKEEAQKNRETGTDNSSEDEEADNVDTGEQD